MKSPTISFLFFSFLSNFSYQQLPFYQNRTSSACDCECGSYEQRESRIVGGEESNPNEFPWMARLQDLTDPIYNCGGTLITSRAILTAAHCVSGLDKSYYHKIRIVLGDHDRNNIDSKIRQYRRVKSVHVHEQFNNKFGYDNDIALVKFDHPVELNKFIQPLCLPPFDENRDYSGQTGIVCGWGRLNEYDSHTSNVLRKLKVPIWSHERCLNSRYVTKKLTKNMICAGYPEGIRDSCNGDSGGPLQITIKTGRMELAGIVSFGQGCARKNLPGVYTKIPNYIEWIEKHLNNDCFCQPFKRK